MGGFDDERQRGGIEIAKREGRYTGRKPGLAHHRRIIGLREAGMIIVRTAELAGCSVAKVKRVTALHRAKEGVSSTKGASSEDEFNSKFVLSTTAE